MLVLIMDLYFPPLLARLKCSKTLVKCLSRNQEKRSLKSSHLTRSTIGSKLSPKSEILLQSYLIIFALHSSA